MKQSEQEAQTAFYLVLRVLQRAAAECNMREPIIDDVCDAILMLQRASGVSDTNTIESAKRLLKSDRPILPELSAAAVDILHSASPPNDLMSAGTQRHALLAAPAFQV